jgi:hypothetical protein
MHYRSGQDFDRRMALISFDNSIEVSIHTYLGLHPIQRQNRTYEKHQLRNDQYHEGSPSSPNWSHLEQLGRAAKWIFAVLFDVENVDALIETYLLRLAPSKPVRQSHYDKVLNDAFGEYQLAGGTYTASELLHAVDPEAYRNLALDLLGSSQRAVGAA